jgi:damage-control phosphatase, subfamily II, stand-alone protein
MPIFSLLADPAGYIPCSTEDMHVDHEYREHWLTHFENHFESILKLAIDNYGASAIPRTEACRRDFFETLHAIHDNPRMLPRLDLLILDMIRQEKLIAHGIPDPFEKTKARENAACVPLYPQVVGELDAIKSQREALLLAINGIFAGNIFDLGAGATTKMFADKSPDFLAVRKGLEGKRPWLVDQFDAMADRLLKTTPTGPRHGQAIFFCDNAGSDFVLGVIPFCRLLARRGTRVILAANRLPALNDMTAREVLELLPQLQALDPELDRMVRHGRIEVVDSGGIAPLIDLREISEEVNRYASATDLVILEGMGRAVETNFEATFKVAAIKLAMIKEEIVARRHGGKNFDTVCRFDASH